MWNHHLHHYACKFCGLGIRIWCSWGSLSLLAEVRDLRWKTWSPGASIPWGLIHPQIWWKLYCLLWSRLEVTQCHIHHVLFAETFTKLSPGLRGGGRGSAFWRGGTRKCWTGRAAAAILGECNPPQVLTGYHFSAFSISEGVNPISSSDDCWNVNSLALWITRARLGPWVIVRKNNFNFTGLKTLRKSKI